MSVDVRQELESVRADIAEIQSRQNDHAAKEIAVWKRIAATPNERVAREAVVSAIGLGVLAETVSAWDDPTRDELMEGEGRRMRRAIWWKHPITGEAMILIPSGTFLLANGPSFGPRHRAQPHGAKKRLGFSMARFPVTNERFRVFVDSTGYRPDDQQSHGRFLAHWSEESPSTEQLQHPVTWVNANDAEAYCDWANGKLPSPEQWQMACRGEDARKYPWGNRDLFSTTGSIEPVGKVMPRSPYGCEDLNGNVSHWCETSAEDRPQWQPERKEQHIVMGACYLRKTGRTANATHERWLHALRRNKWVGFRVCV